jgi:hypothetical protein
MFPKEATRTPIIQEAFPFASTKPQGARFHPAPFYCSTTMKYTIHNTKNRPMLKLTWGLRAGAAVMPPGDYIQTGRGVYAVKLASGAPSDKHAYSKR